MSSSFLFEFHCFYLIRHILCGTYELNDQNEVEENPVDTGIIENERSEHEIAQPQMQAGIVSELETESSLRERHVHIDSTDEQR